MQLLKIQEQRFFHGQTGMTEEEFVLVFITPQVRK